MKKILLPLALQAAVSTQVQVLARLQVNAGILIMNAPDNFDSPEPLRVWPENMEGGELMLNYSPTKMKPWQLTYGNDYTLKYRVMVYKGDITPAEADAVWNDFVFPPQVLLIK